MKMNRIKQLQAITELFAFKTIHDETGSEYVVFRNSVHEDAQGVGDKTAFEALENHVHLLERVKQKEMPALTQIGTHLANALLASLKRSYPAKNFYVYVTISLGNSFIVRFHQQWRGEAPYLDPDAFREADQEKLILLKG